MTITGPTLLVTKTSSAVASSFVQSVGGVDEFSLPTGSKPVFTRFAPSVDGNVWFTASGTDRIGKITPPGVITQYGLTTGAYPWGIAAGPDGNMWFCELFGNKIGKITTSGAITEYVVPTSGSHPGEIVTGPDKNLWFTEDFGNKIANSTTSGTITEYTVNGPNSHP